MGYTAISNANPRQNEHQSQQLKNSVWPASPGVQTKKKGPVARARFSKLGSQRAHCDRNKGTQKGPIPNFGGSPKGAELAGHPVHCKDMKHALNQEIARLIDC